MKRLLILQPYVPSYRVPFFRDLRVALEDKGFELVLAAGQAQGHMAERRDDCTLAFADELLQTRRVGVGGRYLLVRDIGPTLHKVEPHLVIAEQALKNTDIYSLVTRQALKGTPRWGLWGQGRAFSKPQGRTGNFLKQLVTRRSDWFFAYTREGADYVVRHGMSPNRVTTLNNTVDTEQLRRELGNVSDECVTEFRERHSLTPGQTGLFLGGVDPAKGIHFLLEATERITQQIPDFRLIIAGSGMSSRLIQQRQKEGAPIVCVGRLEGSDKALALRAADLMMIPEWVGLVAVDSLVAGCPIATTHHPSHSPEFSYLTDEKNSFIFTHQAKAYADGIIRVLQDSELLADVAQQALRDSWRYTLTGMVDNFSQGVDSWWASSSL